MHLIGLPTYAVTIFLSLALSKSNIIELPYSEFFGSFYTAIHVGNPTQSLLEGINLAHPFTLTTDFFFKMNTSVTVQILDADDLSFNIDTKTFEGIRLIDNIVLPKSNAEIAGYNFYIIQNHKWDHNKRRTGISFANKFNNTALSLVHLLKENYYISKLSFAIVPNNYPNDKGMISFGGIKEEAIVNKSITKCIVDNREPYIAWACRLSYVFIGNLSYENPSKNIYYSNRDYAYFQSSTKMIIAPQRFISFLYQQVINPLIKTNQCVKEDKSKYAFKCTIKSMASVPNITFIFDNIPYSFKSTDYFECLIDWCDILIIPNEDDSWIIGALFIRKFVMNFDYDENIITLYSNETRTTIVIEDLIPVRYWIWFSVIINICFLLLYAYYTYDQRKRKKGGRYYNEYISKEYHKI